MKLQSDIMLELHVPAFQPAGEIDAHTKWVASEEIGQELIKVYSENLIAKVRSLIQSLF